MNKVFLILIVVLVAVIVILQFPPSSQIISTSWPDPDLSFILDTTPVTQSDVHAQCRHATWAMIMLFFDKNYKTSYFGRPTDPALLQLFGEEVEYDIYNLYKQDPDNAGYKTANQIDIWAWYRNQPRVNEIIDYTDTTAFTQMNPGKNFDQMYPDYEVGVISPFGLTYNLIDLNYNFVKNLLDTYQTPLWTVSVGDYFNSGQAHAFPTIGWSEDLSCGEPPQFSPQTVIYNTWNYDPDFPEIDEYSFAPNNFFYYMELKLYRMDIQLLDFDGDFDGSGSLNAGDLRYLMKWMVGDPAFRPLHAHPDVNSDGNWNSGDARYFALYLAGDPEYSPLYPIR